MRLTGLLVLMLFLLILLFASPAASYGQTTANPSANKSTENTLATELNAGKLAELARDARLGSEFERDGVCYTMRTYIMAREEKDSDSTRMVRATRCLPAWKLEFKSAAAPENGDRASASGRR